MDGLCLTCGNWGPVEANHVAGRRNHPTLTVPQCVPCHGIFSAWQRAAGIELHHQADVTDDDSRRALLVGCFHLVTLIALRQPTRWLDGTTCVRLQRAFSRLLDETLPGDRPRRWLPDPTVVLPSVEPAPWVEENRVAWFGELAQFALALLDALDLDPGGIRTLMVSMADDPAWWIDTIQFTARNFRVHAPSLPATLVSLSAVLRQAAILLLDPHLTSTDQQELLDSLWASEAEATRLLLTLTMAPAPWPSDAPPDPPF